LVGIKIDDAAFYGIDILGYALQGYKNKSDNTA